MNIITAWTSILNRDLALLLGVAFIGLGVPIAAYNNFIPLHANSLGLGAGSAFYLFSSITSIAARALGSGLSDRFGRRLVVAPAFILGGAALVLLFKLGSVPMLALAGLFQGLQDGLQGPALLAQISDVQKKASDSAMGIGLFFMAFDAGIWLGTPAFGFVADAIGFGPSYIALTACLAVGAALVLSIRPRADAGPPHEVFSNV